MIPVQVGQRVFGVIQGKPGVRYHLLGSGDIYGLRLQMIG
jgi:hypothetical protein